MVQRAQAFLERHGVADRCVLMLLTFDGARERTLGQYRALLEGTGWRLERVLASPGPMSVVEASRRATG